MMNDFAPEGLIRRPKPGKPSSHKNTSPRTEGEAASTVRLVSFGMWSPGKQWVSTGKQFRVITDHDHCPNCIQKMPVCQRSSNSYPSWVSRRKHKSTALRRQRSEVQILLGASAFPAISCPSCPE